jgi:hypothetical protein
MLKPAGRQRSSLGRIVLVGVLSFGATSFGPASAMSGRVWAQTKPTPVKAVAADSAAPTRVVAGVPPLESDTIPAAPVPNSPPKKVGNSTSGNKSKVRLAAASLPTAEEILANKAILLTDRARGDIKAGVVDPRLLGTLAFMAKKFPIEVTTIRTGHSRFVKGTSRESNHYYARAADIGRVDSLAVAKGNQSALSLANYLLTLPGDIRPTELGSPWSGDGSGADVDVFSDEGHDNHIHIGFDD